MMADNLKTMVKHSEELKMLIASRALSIASPIAQRTLELATERAFMLSVDWLIRVVEEPLSDSPFETNAKKRYVRVLGQHLGHQAYELLIMRTKMVSNTYEYSQLEVFLSRFEPDVFIQIRTHLKQESGTEGTKVRLQRKRPSPLA